MPAWLCAVHSTRLPPASQRLLRKASCVCAQQAAKKPFPPTPVPTPLVHPRVTQQQSVSQSTRPPTLPAEYLEVMKDKGITLRTDVFEVALAALEGGAGGGGSAEPAA